MTTFSREPGESDDELRARIRRSLPSFDEMKDRIVAELSREESNAQFARRMRAKRNGISYDEQKRLDFATVGGSTRFPLPHRVESPEDARDLIGMIANHDNPVIARGWLNAALLHFKAEEAYDAEPDGHALMRLKDAVVDCWGDRARRFIGHFDEKVDIWYNLPTGRVLVDEMYPSVLRAFCEEQYIRTRCPDGWLLTAAEMKHEIAVHVAQRNRLVGP